MPYPPELAQDFVSTNSVVFVNVTDIIGGGFLHRISTRRVSTDAEIKLTIDGHIETLTINADYQTVKLDDDFTIANIFEVGLYNIDDPLNVWFKDNLKVEIRNAAGNTVKAKVLYALL